MVYKAVIVGMGGHAMSWKRNIDKHDEIELVACVDTDTEKLERDWKKWGVDDDCVYPTLKEMALWSDESWDENTIAIIATPIPTHWVLSIQAMQMGMNVICEKNLCSSIQQGRAMVKEALANPHLCTATGTQTRYFYKYWTLKKFVTENAERLGPLSFFNFTTLYNNGTREFRWRHMLDDPVLEDMCPHSMDYLRYLTGMDVIEVNAHSFRHGYSNFCGNSGFTATMALAKPGQYEDRDNYLIGQYRADWFKKGKGGQTYELLFENADVLMNEEGIFVNWYTDIEGREYKTEKVPLAHDVDIYEYPQNIEYKYEEQLLILDQMVTGMKSKGKIQPGTNWRDSFKSFCITQAVKEANTHRKVVRVPDYWKDLL
ncbi:MAG: Gfo/Idh/MocA family protein [Candidatus Hodarchaeota archaeon]